jgi:hypothetical protein
MVAPGANGSCPLSTDDATKPTRIIPLNNPQTRTTGFQGTRIYMAEPPGTKSGPRIPILYCEKPRHFVDILPLPNWIIALPSAGGSAPTPHPVAGFGCKVFKYLLGLQETLQSRPGSNLITTRRFSCMAARNSRCHQTLKRGLEQCSPTLKSATFSLSISSLRN